MIYLLAYLATTFIFFVLDFIWLAVVAKDFFQEQIGFLLAEQFNLAVAGLFYLSYTVGILVFAIRPAMQDGGSRKALGYGCLFGFLAYGTYDFTNLATIKDWPVIVTIVDVTWGAFLTGVSAVAGYFSLKFMKKSASPIL